MSGLKKNTRLIYSADIRRIRPIKSIRPTQTKSSKGLRSYLSTANSSKGVRSRPNKNITARSSKGPKSVVGLSTKLVRQENVLIVFTGVG